jgi:glycosyltransferase involved in cell wall biosynthesis
MHVALLFGGGIPNPSTGGGPLTAYTVLRHLLDSGDDVTVFALHDRDYHDAAGAELSARISHLREVGAEVVPIPSDAAAAVDAAPRDVRSRVRRSLTPRVEDLYPHSADAARVRTAVARTDCNVAFVYHFEALAGSRELDIPRVAGVGDPSHLPVYYRWRDALPSRAALRQTNRVQAIMRAQPRYMAALLEECAAYGAFAAHHAEWLRAHGAPRCAYFRTPVPDEAGSGWFAHRRRRPPGAPPRILLLGHLKGIVTIDGFRVFEQVLPWLDRAFGADGYIIDVVGGAEPPRELARILEHPAVRRHGHADGAGAWLQETDVLAVPTSIPLGIRVRIISGLSYGTPIVAHSASALGIPELEDGVNALLATSPREMGEQIVRVVSDRALSEHLERGARATYERYFSPSVAAEVIARELRQSALATASLS